MWCIFLVRDWEEGVGLGGHTTTMWGFSDFILELGLVDLPLPRIKYNRSINQDPHSKSQLDSCLLLAEWDEHFPDITQNVLPQILSAHCAIVLGNGRFNEISL